MEELYDGFVRIFAQNVVFFPDVMPIFGLGEGVLAYGT